MAQLSRFDPNDVVGLLGRIGAESVGAVSVWLTGSAPAEPPQYRRYSTADLLALFDERHGERLLQAQLESQQVLSGVQRKLVFRREGADWLLPLAGAPSTHIIKRSSGRYPGLVANEIACLGLFAAVGLPVPDIAPIVAEDDADTRAEEGSESLLLAVRRFDRVEHADRIERLHQEDFCQLTGRRPSAKYQAGGGPGFAELAAVLRRWSVRPAEDLTLLLRASIANVLLGNGDAHAKNFALLSTPTGRRLAPFYDVVSTELYPLLSPTFAMRFGHAERANALTAADVLRLAKDFGVTPALVRQMVEDVCDRMLSELEATLRGTVALTRDPHDVLTRLGEFVSDRVTRVRGLL